MKIFLACAAMMLACSLAPAYAQIYAAAGYDNLHEPGGTAPGGHTVP